MPKAQLKIADHSHSPGENVVEVWHDGKFVAAIYGAEFGSDGHGIKIISKHQIEIKTDNLNPKAALIRFNARNGM